MRPTYANLVLGIMENEFLGFIPVKPNAGFAFLMTFLAPSPGAILLMPMAIFTGDQIHVLQSIAVFINFLFLIPVLWDLNF